MGGYYERTPEHKKKMSEACKKNPRTPFFKGKHLPEALCKKISIALTGLKKTPETIERIRKSKQGKPNLKWLGRHHSEETKQKISKIKKGKPLLKIRGSNHWLWKGGNSSERKKIITSLEYTKWRRSVFERDDYTCVWCGARNGNGKYIALQADHIKPFCDYPDLRFNLDNGRTLCVPCHRKTDTYGIKLVHQRRRLKCLEIPKIVSSVEKN